MVLETIPEEPEDEHVDLFNLPDGEGAPSRGAIWRSVSAPSRFRFDSDAAAEQRREHVIIPSNQKARHKQGDDTQGEASKLRIHESCWTTKTPAKADNQPLYSSNRNANLTMSADNHDHRPPHGSPWQRCVESISCRNNHRRIGRKNPPLSWPSLPDPQNGRWLGVCFSCSTM